MVNGIFQPLRRQWSEEDGGGGGEEEENRVFPTSFSLL
jgi:hypothetical protein